MALLGEHLLAWRRAKRLNQTRLAQSAGLAQSTLSDLECNRIDPTLGTVRRLAAVLGITPGELIDRKPSTTVLDRHQLDRIARRALRLSREKLSPSEERLAAALARVSRSRLRAAGIPVRRQWGNGTHLSRRLQAEWGASYWSALQQRLGKLLSQVSSTHAA